MNFYVTLKWFWSLKRNIFWTYCTNRQMCTLEITEKGNVCTLTFCPLPQHARWAGEGHESAQYSGKCQSWHLGRAVGRELKVQIRHAILLQLIRSRWGFWGNTVDLSQISFQGQDCTKSGNISGATCVSACIFCWGYVCNTLLTRYTVLYCQ